MSRSKLTGLGFLLTFATLFSLGARADSSPQQPIVEATPEKASCIRARSVRNLEVVNEQAILVRGTAKRFWLSTLPSQCSGLDERKILQVNRYGSQICANDRFEVHDRGGFGALGSCHFGAFEPITPEQVATLGSGA